MKKSALGIILAALALAACGGSGSEQKAVADCYGGGNGPTWASCECAVSRAQAAGISPDRLIRESHDGSVLSDSKLVMIAFSCYGAGG
jgi:hypothetical protein